MVSVWIHSHSDFSHIVFTTRSKVKHDGNDRKAIAIKGCGVKELSRVTVPYIKTNLHAGLVQSRPVLFFPPRVVLPPVFFVHPANVSQNTKPKVSYRSYIKARQDTFAGCVYFALPTPGIKNRD